MAPPGVIERGLLLKMRFDLDLYVNQRPFEAPGHSFVVIRENTEGEYSSVGGRMFEGTDRVLTSPLAGVTGPTELMDAVPPGGLGGTFGGNPLSCAAAIEVLREVASEGFRKRADDLGVKGRHGALRSMATRGSTPNCAAMARAWVSRPLYFGSRDGWMLSSRPAKWATNPALRRRM